MKSEKNSFKADKRMVCPAAYAPKSMCMCIDAYNMLAYTFIFLDIC